MNDRQISFCNFREAKTMISQIVSFYNDERPQRYLKYLFQLLLIKLTMYLKENGRLITIITPRQMTSQYCL